MIKIFMTVRDRLAITQKSIEALYTHSKLPFQLYIYNNCTKDKLKEHFEYFYKLYAEELITQITFNTEDSTFNAFSKAASSNQFGRLHNEDPNKNKYDFLLFIDNDIIVLPEWDLYLKDAWIDVNKYGMKNVKVIGQLPGGIRYTKPVANKIAGCSAQVGKLGGSGFWSVRPNFFQDVGFLDLSLLIGFHKKHDQHYWGKMNSCTNGEPYIMGLKKLMCIHCGKLAGSICNTLSSGGLTNLERQRSKLSKLEKRIDQMEFEDFIKYIIDNKELARDW